MKAPITITPFTLTIANKRYQIKPRLEPIALNRGLMPECFGYELLCTVYGPERKDPDDFFRRLAPQDILRIYNQTLQQFPYQGEYHVTLNICSALLTSPALYQLLAMFPNIVFYLELSEKSHGLQDVLRAQEMIRSYPGLQAFIWLDDFGSNFANFDSLIHHRFDGIKLAKEVFWGLYEDDRDLLAKIIQFLHRNSPLVIVEGVDSAERFDFVMANDCAAQGYFLSAL